MKYVVFIAMFVWIGGWYFSPPYAETKHQQALCHTTAMVCLNLTTTAPPSLPPSVLLTKKKMNFYNTSDHITVDVRYFTCVFH